MLIKLDHIWGYFLHIKNIILYFIDMETHIITVRQKGLALLRKCVLLQQKGVQH